MDAPKVSNLIIKTGSDADEIPLNNGDVILDTATGICSVAIDNSIDPMAYNYTDIECAAPKKTVHTRITSKDGICSRCGAPLNSNYDCEYCGAKYKFEEVY